MIRRKQESILASAPGIEALKRFIQLLNTDDYWSASLLEGRQKIGGDYRKVKREMRRLVQAWLHSGPNVSKLFDAEPMLDRAARSFRPHFIPTKSGTARLAYLTAPEYEDQANPREIALGLFLNFLLNPYNEKLGGPCKHCGNFYVKRTDRKKSVYCSEKCGHRLTSLLTNKARRNREHKEQLQLAERSTAKWLNLKLATPWKVWVSNRTNIKKHWLTRAVRNGELVEPVKQT
jgi:hypothetical protein